MYLVLALAYMLTPDASGAGDVKPPATSATAGIANKPV
jgi:hypothetical protein